MLKIIVFGAGGVGGYFGGLLAQKGHDVTFLARGDHLAAIQAHGLKVHSVHGDFHVWPVKATDRPAEVEPADYILVAVKHYQLDQAGPQLAPMAGPHTTVVPLLNGIDAHEKLAAYVSPGALVGGLCSIVSMIKAPGIIHQASKLRRVVLGELDKNRSERVDRLVREWKEIGVEAIHAEDIFVAMWTKFLFIASFGGVSSLARATAGEIMANAETRQLFIDAMAEIRSLATAYGIHLPVNVVETTLDFFSRLEPTATSSMQRDVAAGKPFELEAFSGKIVRLGQQFGVETPVHRAIYALLRPALDRAMPSG